MGDETDDTKDDGGSVPPVLATAKKRPFGFLDTDPYKDKSSPLIGKFLKDHAERLEEELVELRPYRENYYKVKSQLEIVQGRASLTRTARAVSSALLALGGVGIGVAKDIWDTGYGSLLLVCASLLIVSTFFLKVRDT